MTIVTLVLLFAWIWRSNTAAKHDMGVRTELGRALLEIGRFLRTCLSILFCCRFFSGDENISNQPPQPPGSPSTRSKNVTNDHKTLVAQQAVPVMPPSTVNTCQNTTSTQSNQTTATNQSQASNATGAVIMSNGTQSRTIHQNISVSQSAMSHTQTPIPQTHQATHTTTSFPTSAQTSNLPTQSAGVQVNSPTTTLLPVTKEAEQTSTENSSQESGRPASTMRSRPRFIQNLLHLGSTKTKNSNPC